MKIKDKQYAIALYESLAGKKAGEVKVVVKNFVKILVKNNDLGRLRRIINFFEDVWSKGENEIEAEIISARNVSQDVVRMIYEFIAQKTKAQKVEIEKTIDKDVLGGVVIKYNDKIFDGSVRTKMSALKEKMLI
jgi:F-type H+-transporting ATPase subunit delta